MKHSRVPSEQLLTILDKAPPLRDWRVLERGFPAERPYIRGWIDECRLLCYKTLT
jgi:hypothetical protein